MSGLRVTDITASGDALNISNSEKTIELYGSKPDTNKS